MEQSRELAAHITKADPPVDVIYSSPFYRCLQTLVPTVDALNSGRPEQDKLLVHAENGIGEFYGLARFDHPSPATIDVLATHFPDQLNKNYDQPIIRPSTNGESLQDLHDRIAYALHHIIKRLDEDPKGPKTLLICTHAASMICIGRALTGRMPEDMGEEDFKCFTCAFSKFTRRQKSSSASQSTEPEVWDAANPDKIPNVKWEGGVGVQGGWDCVVNGDCSFLKEGEERGWYVAFLFSHCLSLFLSLSFFSTFRSTLRLVARFSGARWPDLLLSHWISSGSISYFCSGPLL